VHTALKKLLALLTSRGTSAGLLPKAVREKLGSANRAAEVEARVLRLITALGLLPRRVREDKVHIHMI
jgi:hypothetical protein